MAIFTSSSLNGFKVMMLVLCLSSYDDGRRPSKIQPFNFASFPERARSGRFDYIIMQVLKPSPLWYLNYRMLGRVGTVGMGWAGLSSGKLAKPRFFHRPTLPRVRKQRCPS